jgi:hypothetical protein
MYNAYWLCASDPNAVTFRLTSPYYARGPRGDLTRLCRNSTAPLTSLCPHDIYTTISYRQAFITVPSPRRLGYYYIHIIQFDLPLSTDLYLLSSSDTHPLQLAT